MAGNPKPGVQEDSSSSQGLFRLQVKRRSSICSFSNGNRKCCCNCTIKCSESDCRTPRPRSIGREASSRQRCIKKRKAYFLTTPGVVLADETWKRLRDYKFRVIQEDNSTESTTLGDAHKILPFQMRSVDIIRYLDDSGILDVRNLNEDLVQRDAIQARRKTIGNFSW